MSNLHRQAQTILLADGRRLGYAEYGQADGFPILLFHGTPGCRLWFANDDAVALSLGLRLVALDRPGFGLSDPKPGRSILDWPADVAALADQLELPTFSVLGVSGGGVYAAACAYLLPQRLQAAALVSTIAPFEKGKTPRSMCWPNRIAFYLSRYALCLLKLSYKQQKKLLDKDPGRYLHTLQTQIEHLCERDKQAVQAEETALGLLLQLKEALRQGPDAAATEPALLSRNWDFRCEDITFPVQLWHGTADTLAPFAEAQKLESLLPACTAHSQEGDGHFMIENPQVWAALLENLAPKNTQDSLQLPGQQLTAR